MSRSLRESFRNGHVRFGLLLVIITGLVQSFFLCKTFVDPGQRQYRLDFGQFPWVEPPQPSPAGYFRTTLYISNPVERGWIEIAATDHFLAYVNGKRLDEKYFGGARVSGIYDIRHLLLQGKNVIAIYVPRVFAPGSSQLIVRGAYAIAGARDQEFGTSAQWKASNTPDGVIEHYQWFDVGLDDAGWASARPVPLQEKPAAVQAVAVPPRIFLNESRAQRIGSSDASVRAASFEGKFRLPARREETWLQVAATGAYDVFVNDHYVIAQPVVQRTVLPFAQPSAGGPADVTSSQLTSISRFNQRAARAELPLQVPAQPTVPTLLAYDISRFLRTGENRIVIRVRADNEPALVLADVTTLLSGGAEWHFTTGPTWNVITDGTGANVSSARELGVNGDAPWGALPQAAAALTFTPAWDLIKYGPWALGITVATVVFITVWILMAVLVVMLTGGTLSHSLALDAVLHVPALVFLLTCWLLTFDVRFDTDWCFHPGFCLTGFAILFVGRILLLLGVCLFNHEAASTSLSHASNPNRYLTFAAFVAVALLGLCLRAWDLNGTSLGSDEVTMIINADGILQSGYPHSPRGSFDRVLATYELVPYVLAASSAIFGRTEFAYHLPALIFSTLTVALIGYVGRRMFDWRIGLTSAFIYACFPPSIAWARNAFYPSQEQLLSLLTFWTFYEAIRAGPFQRRFLTWATVGFILSYLSWEGSGFIVPAFFVAVLALRWGDFSWVGDWHLWRCFVLMTVVVLVQLSYRQLTIDSYFGVGYSLSDVTAPTLVYRDLLVYNPWYYLRVLFFPEVNFVLSLFLFLGFLFCWGNRPIRYVVVVLFTLELSYSNLLPFYAPRYCYNTETLVILAGVSIYFRFHDRIVQLGGVTVPGWFQGFRRFAGAALTVWLLLATNEFAVWAYRISPDAKNPALFARLGHRKTDHRAAAHFVQQRLQPGDAVVAFMPHMFQFYTNRPADYSINTLLNSKMTYDGIGTSPVFIDKFLGRPLIRSLDQLMEVQTRFNRLWILVPTQDDSVALSPNTLDYLNHKATVAFESYREQVYVLQGIPRAATDPAGKTLPD